MGTPRPSGFYTASSRRMTSGVPEAREGIPLLWTTSNFSFLRGASHPEELVERAGEAGYAALALTDRNTLAGVVRAHAAAERIGLQFIPGARLDLDDGPGLLCLPTDKNGYGRLSRLITLGRRRAPKGECSLFLRDVALAFRDAPSSLVLILAPGGALSGEKTGRVSADLVRSYRKALAPPLYLAAACYRAGDDARRLRRLARISEEADAPLVAALDVLHHVPERRKLLDVLSCIRMRATIDSAGWRLSPNAERHIVPAQAMERLFRDYPEALENARRIASRCRFSLRELRYRYPAEGKRPHKLLADLTWKGAGRRYPTGVPRKVRKILKHELRLIGELRYAPYFLTVYDLARAAKERGILCQGRGSAANSAVCYCLGITSVDPEKFELLFERFISAERDEAPDIDLDFEHERREEIIQYIYRKYGRERAGLAAAVVAYRARSAIRDVGKAMGLGGDIVDRLLAAAAGSVPVPDEEAVRREGLDPTDRRLRLVLELARELQGFPRHLSQHTGGFVISREPLCEIVPIENAAMEDRTVIQWNKDDLKTLGIIKVDILALGMLTCIRKALELLRDHCGIRYGLESIPGEDSCTYEMIRRADTVGVFQIESRAQMAMLPRLRPKTFYDLVIQVAIVRPGPIQGEMVHPYLRRRQGKEAVEYPSNELKQVLKKTLGVPLFQEQAMRIAITGAGFTPAEADQLRRAMAAFRNPGTIHGFRERFIRGMKAKGYGGDFAERCFKQIEGFGSYGFPESHAASFAYLAYVSAWLKRRHPAIFACALLNSQPMGFYAPAQIVADARNHGVEARPADVNHSEWDCTLEEGEEGIALRLGMRMIRGFRKEDAEKVVRARGAGARTPRELGLSSSALARLAKADAFISMKLNRREAAWAAISEPLPLFRAPPKERALPRMTTSEQVAADYRATGLSLKRHPISFVRERLDRMGILPAARLKELRDGDAAKVAGIVLARQRPGKGIVMFVTLEDETGIANLVVFPRVYERQRREALVSRAMLCEGRVQAEDSVIHVVAARVFSLGIDDSYLRRGRFFR